jgi:hypothetical protein
MCPTESTLLDGLDVLGTGVVPQPDVSLRDRLGARLRGQMLAELLTVQSVTAHLKGSFSKARRTLTLFCLGALGSGLVVSAN